MVGCKIDLKLCPLSLVVSVGYLSSGVYPAGFIVVGPVKRVSTHCTPVTLTNFMLGKWQIYSSQ